MNREVSRKAIELRKEFQRQELKHGSEYIVNSPSTEETLTGLLAVAGQYIGLALAVMKVSGLRADVTTYNKICKEIREVAFTTMKGLDALNKEVGNED